MRYVDFLWTLVTERCRDVSSLFLNINQFQMLCAPAVTLADFVINSCVKTFLLNNNLSFGQLISGLYRRVHLASCVVERKTVTFSGRSRKNNMLTPTGAVAMTPYYKSASLKANTFSWKKILGFNFTQRTRLDICKLRGVSPFSFLVANILTFYSILSIHIKASEYYYLLKWGTTM